MSRKPGAPKRERGAVLVEFVLVLPILLIFLFAVIEFSWAFSQHLDIRHGAREGLRIAQVNHNPFAETGSNQTLTMSYEVCGRMSRASGRAVSFEFETTKGTGDIVVVTVHAPVQQITGFFGPSVENISLKSELHGRLERPASFDANGGILEVLCP